MSPRIYLPLFSIMPQWFSSLYRILVQPWPSINIYKKRRERRYRSSSKQYARGKNLEHQLRHLDPSSLMQHEWDLPVDQSIIWYQNTQSCSSITKILRQDTTLTTSSRIMMLVLLFFESEDGGGGGNPTSPLPRPSRGKTALFLCRRWGRLSFHPHLPTNQKT